MREHVAMIHLLTLSNYGQRLFMACQGGADSRKNLWRDDCAANSGSRGMLPRRILAPVDIRTITAAVGATIAAPQQKVPRGDIKTIGGDFPVSLRSLSIPVL